MCDFGLLAFLPCDEEAFAGGISEFDGSGFPVDKVVRRYLASIDHCQNKPVGEHGPEFFHEVESE